MSARGLTELEKCKSILKTAIEYIIQVVPEHLLFSVRFYRLTDIKIQPPKYYLDGPRLPTPEGKIMEYASGEVF